MDKDDAVTDGATFADAVVFPSHFKDLKDPRQQGKVACPLDEIPLLCPFAVLAGAECFTEIALFGVNKRDFLRRFRPFKDGTPDHGHLGDIRAVLDAEQLQRCFVAWVAVTTGMPEGVIAIDGKTVRRSAQKRNGKAAIRMVSAFAAGRRLVLGQVMVAEKSNEIIAIPKLLDQLAIDGTIVTIDTMGCRRDIAQVPARSERDAPDNIGLVPLVVVGVVACVAPLHPVEVEIGDPGILNEFPEQLLHHSWMAQTAMIQQGVIRHPAVPA